MTTAQTSFDGRYGIQRDDRYELLKFENPSAERIAELVLHSSPPGTPWGDAIISYDCGDRSCKLIVLSHSELGYFLHHEETDDRSMMLSCWDREKLGQVECPDDLEVSTGLFVPPKEAFDAIMHFLGTGERAPNISWISPSEVPAGGNYC